MADAIETLVAASCEAEKSAPSIGSRGCGREGAGSGPIFFSQGPFQTDWESNSTPRFALQDYNSHGREVDSGPKKHRYTVRYWGNPHSLLRLNPADDL